MYHLLSQLTVDQELARAYDPDRLHRAAAWAHRTRSGEPMPTGPRTSRLIGRLRSGVGAWVRRGSLGPVAAPCAGERIAQWP
jgi:hypothetical protein